MNLNGAIHSRAVGLAVRGERIAKGISQEKLAEKTSLHRTYIGAVERGERNMTLRNVFAIAGGLGIKTSRLIEIAESIEDELKHD